MAENNIIRSHERIYNSLHLHRIYANSLQLEHHKNIIINSSTICVSTWPVVTTVAGQSAQIISILSTYYFIVSGFILLFGYMILLTIVPTTTCNDMCVHFGSVSEVMFSSLYEMIWYLFDYYFKISEASYKKNQAKIQLHSCQFQGNAIRFQDKTKTKTKIALQAQSQVQW